jgi:hypothetical protein
VADMADAASSERMLPAPAGCGVQSSCGWGSVTIAIDSAGKKKDDEENHNNSSET